jgi:hypothetical protein
MGSPSNFSVGGSLARDGKSIVYIQHEFVESNIMLVKNFHYQAPFSLAPVRRSSQT